MKAQPRHPHSGFTLIELLTVIAIIGILAAIIIPVVGKVRSSARTATTLSNMRQITQAFMAYAADNKTLIPCATHSGAGGKNPTGGFWHHELTPYVGGTLDLKPDGTVRDARKDPAAKFFNEPVWSTLLGYDQVQKAIDENWADIRTGYSMNNQLGYALGGAIGAQSGQFQANSSFTVRHRLTAYPNPSRTIILGMGHYEGFTVSTVGIEQKAAFKPDGSGDTVEHFRRLGADSSGKGGSKGGFGFLDGSVRALPPPEAAAFLKRL
jgi:prepilin-type N-terminal cleavage/methylation domain-containing protein